MESFMFPHGSVALLLSGDFGGFDFVASAAGPTGQVRKDLTLLPIHTWLHLTPPLLGYNGRFHTGGSGSGRASDLPRETGTLDGLRALLNLILITAAMHRHHLTCPLLHLV